MQVLKSVAAKKKSSLNPKFLLYKKGILKLKIFEPAVEYSLKEMLV